METLWQDIKYGTRLLARSPGFTMVVIAILGIGIGGTTAMLSAIDAAMFRPCPYRDSERLAWLGETDSGRRYGEMVSLPNFHDWREQSHSFEQLAAVGHRGCTVRDAGRTEKSDAILVSEGFFSVLGVQPLLGRLFLPNEETLGGQRAVILSEGQWQRWFARDPNAIGRMLVIDKVPHTVVGVLPGEFHWIFRRDCGLWLSMAIEPTDETHRGSRGSDVIGRLKPGITVDQAQAEMDVIADRLAHTHAETLRDVGVLVVPMREAYRTAVGRSGNVRVLMILLGIVASVLLMACLHVAGLLLARAAAREKEIAVRTALGADRLRLVRQLLAESVLLAGLGGGAGLLLAHWGVRLLATVGGDLTGLIPWFVEPRVDSRTLLYALGVSLATCGLFGALPAVWISRVNPGRFLTAGRTGGQGPRLNRLRAVLVTGDLAIAFVLLVMAALIINTYVRILDFRSGIDARNFLAIEIDADTGTYSVPDRRSAFFQQVLEQ
ncbi:MAG: ABC transporter permease, partial [Phycisphaerales bacterium]